MQKNKPTAPVYSGAPAGFNISGAQIAKHSINAKQVTVNNAVVSTYTLGPNTGTVRLVTTSAPVMVRFNASGESAVSYASFDMFLPINTEKMLLIDSSVTEFSIITPGTVAYLWVIEH